MLNRQPSFTFDDSNTDVWKVGHTHIQEVDDCHSSTAKQNQHLFRQQHLKTIF